MILSLLAQAQSAVPAPGAAHSERLLKLCSDQIATLGSLGEWFLIASLALGILMALVALVAAFKSLPAAGGGASKNLTDEAAGAAAEAVAKLLEALTKAPIWIALFGCGLSLFWLALAYNHGSCGTASASPAAGTGAPVAPASQAAGA